MPRRGLLLTLLLSRAYAQEGPDVAPPAPEMAPEPLGTRFVWERRPTVAAGVRLADLDIQPVVQGAWVAVDERGGVWLSEDDGARWDSVLLGAGVDEDEFPDDEELLLEAESRRDEALDGADDELEVTTEPESATPATEEEDTEVPEPELEEEVDIDDAGGLAAVLAGDGSRDARVRPSVWVDPTQTERVFVSRDDGLWRSDDAGRTWSQVSHSEDEDALFTTFFRGPDGVLVGGTTDGVRFSLDDGANWIDAEDATDGARVFHLLREDGTLWAAGDRGLFRSANGLQWDRVALPTTGEIRAVVPDPFWDRGFWVATNTELLRTDDGGASFYIAGRQPLRGLREMVHLGEPGHLLATSDNGVWESMDGGVAWGTADRLLGDPDVRALVLTDTGPIVATPGGAWRMVAPREITEVRREDESLSLPRTIEASVTRPGMRIDPLSVRRLGVAAALLPKLELRFDWGSSAARRASLVSESTTDSFDNDWSAAAKLCWGACTTTVYVSPNGDIEVEVDYSDANFYVFDGDVYDDSEPVAAAANVAERIRNYRRYLADHVADAWLARSRLVAESSAVKALPLRDQVLHTLQIQELDARLDALTDGEFSRTDRRPDPDSEESR